MFVIVYRVKNIEYNDKLKRPHKHFQIYPGHFL